MKINKLSAITALALGGLVACSTMAVAQDQKPGGGKRGQSVEARMEQMTEQLKLTDDQKPKVKEVLEGGQKKMAELRNDSSLSADDRREKMASIRTDEDKKLKAILTPEQQEKWQKMREEFRGRGGKKGEAKKESSGDTKKD